MKHNLTNTPSKPYIQIALDTLTIEDAIEQAQAVREHIDIIEVGTILLGAVGKAAISILKKVFPEKIIVTDFKIADAGSVFGEMAFNSGTDLVTVICAADVNTIKSVKKVATQFDHQPQIQIELTGHCTAEQLKAWKEAGATHVVYHRSRDAQLAGVLWNQTDLDQIKMIQDHGMLVSITGGIETNDIAFFKDLNPYCFIAGRYIRGKDGLQNVLALKAEINKYFK